MSFQVALHPLVLLTISDYITRHTLRQQKGPVVGALLGQQNGREITIEHAFEVLCQETEGEIVLNQAWFEERLQQMKDVHKAPPLDLVGWYTTLPQSGPEAAHLPLHKQILQTYNESALLLGFHPSSVLEGSSVGGKLPLTIYESNFEADETKKSGEDEEMQDGEPTLGLKFTELPYTIETGEAEFISVDFVARGGGNATAVDNSTSTSKKPSTESSKPSESSEKSKGKGKAKKDSDTNGTKEALDENRILSREDEEAIASLTAKANAIKMLHARINLISTYLTSISSQSPTSQTTPQPTASHPLLRSISALLSRLTLLIPSNTTAFSQELLSEQNDVGLVGLLNDITQSVKDVRELGKKFSVVDAQRGLRSRSNGGGGWDMGGGMGMERGGGFAGGGGMAGMSGVSGAGDLMA